MFRRSLVFLAHLFECRHLFLFCAGYPALRSEDTCCNGILVEYDVEPRDESIDINTGWHIRSQPVSVTGFLQHCAVVKVVVTQAAVKVDRVVSVKCIVGHG